MTYRFFFRKTFSKSSPLVALHTSCIFLLLHLSRAAFFIPPLCRSSSSCFFFVKDKSLFFPFLSLFPINTSKSLLQPNTHRPPPSSLTTPVTTDPSSFTNHHCCFLTANPKEEAELVIDFDINGDQLQSQISQVVLRAVLKLYKLVIKLPDESTPSEIRNNPRFYPYFKDCIGALDGTHVRASVPLSIQGRFRSRKGGTTQNVLAAITFDLKFSYVLAGWEGSAHDSRILSDALSRPRGLRIPEGKYYLADAGYGIRNGYITPYRGVRYHLKEFSDQGPENAKELFNLRHSSLRITIERVFGILKKRFRVLDAEPFWNFQTQVDIVLACCIIHNHIMGVDPSDLLNQGLFEEPDSDLIIPTLREREEREEAREWSAKRDEIAQTMWVDYMTRNIRMGKGNKEGTSKQFRWTKPMEHLFLEILAEEAQKGNKPSNSFKAVSINRVAKAISERFQVHCDAKHVENHLRTVKNQWQIICTIRGESGFGWDDNLKMITCDRATYDATVMAHKKYEPFLNKSIDHYDEMALVVGKDMATGSFARTFADIALDDDNQDSVPVDCENEEVEEVRTKVSSSGTSKRKRKNTQESDVDEQIKFMGEQLGKIANALEQFTADKTPQLYEELMSMEEEGFDDDFLCSVFDYLLKRRKSIPDLFTLVMCWKLWGIFHGLSIAWEKGFKKVVVECDSSQAVQLLNDGQAPSDNLALVRNILQLCGHGWDICIVHLPPHGLPIKWLAK
ncbi:hypothetical protein PVK06_021535 [Gossypium arboreum]|uniref:Nuclease HARBI1 n=1 Tax=Gossypium arboreum TaxID=29729 RepID=A0ABR0PQA2_GOSAR|nr:hypothetical protein PVK06_021535 [Gossypium arboreum]